MINMSFFLPLKLFYAIVKSCLIKEKKEQNHVVQSVFAKIRYYKVAG